MTKTPAQIQIFSRVSFLDKLLFTKHLAVMVKAGIPVPEALVSLADQTKSAAFKKVTSAVIADVENGQNLAKSLEKFPKVFDKFYVSLIAIGEESGNLEENLAYLASELQKSYEFDKKVKGAMLYPELIISVALVMGGGISIYVLPQLANLFTSLDVKLPLTTRILLYISVLMQHYGLIIVPSVFAVFFLLTLLVKTAAVKPLWHRFLLKIPIFGTFIQNSQTAGFCRNLGLMLKSGLSIIASLKASAASMDNVVYKGYILSLIKTVEKGKSLSDELANGQYPYFPSIVAKMVGVGEKTGKLDETLLYLGDFFADEVDATAKNLPSILEPALLVIIAAIVLFLALAIIGPIYDLTGSIRQ